MAKRVVDYVKGMLQKGYSVSAIRNAMLKYGYTDKDVNDAIDEVNNPTVRHELHLSKATVFVVIFAVIAIVGAAVFIYYPDKAQSKLLDLNLEPLSTTAAPGESISFVKELSNMGSSTRYDVVITQEILNQATFEIVTGKTETRAIETFGSTQTQIEIPLNTKPGNYLLRAIVEYDGKKAVATLPVKVIAGQKQSCFDGVKNQDEEKTDCGGQCSPCTLNEGCNDNDSCTNDLLENGLCINKPIIPCCGNSICETDEKCDEDCRATGQPNTLENIEEIGELAKTNPGSALQECNKVEVSDLRDECIGKIGEVQRSRNYCSQVKNSRTRDLCYSNVAQLSKDSTSCEGISSDGIRDHCYMTFALDYKDYSACDKLINSQLKQSCDYLRQLNEMNSQNQ
ncbi:hypothetical protein HYS31_04810 [Candidatus Woesearchaeota archaeon]|nr:hypothetical protein [Candidatus Woesearchaeota archaeon]